MRRFRRVALLAVTSITVAACLPRRDNGDDPANRPSAVLSVASGGFIPYGAVGVDADGDGCVDLADSVSPVLARAKCLHLSAVGTSDPQGDATIESYGFRLLATSSNATGVRVLASSGVGASSSAVFRASVLRQQPPEGTYQAELTVTDRNGYQDVVVAPIQIENSRPIAVPPSPRFVTNWGAAWTTNGSMDYSVLRPITVHFTADGSFDPDGDPLLYCWKDRTNGVDLGCRTDPGIAVQPAASTSSGKMVLELTVGDALEFSQAVLATAVLDSLPGWAFENDTASVKVLDDRRTSFDLDNQDSGIPKFREPFAIDVVPGALAASTLYFSTREGGADDRTIARRQIGQMCAGCSADPLQFVTLAFVDPANPVLPVKRVTNVLHHPSLSFVWVVGVADDSTVFVQARNRTSLAHLASATSQTTFFTDDTGFAVIDRNGRLWVGSPFTDESVICYEFTASPAGISECGSIAIEEGHLLTGLAIRPVAQNGQEIWAMQSRNFLAGAGGPPFAHVVDAADPLTFVKVPVNTEEVGFTADLAFTLEFVDGNLSWLNLFGEGIASVELCDPTPGAPSPGNGSIAEPTELCVRSVAPFEASFDTLSDPATGTFVALGLEGHSLNRMTLGGTSSRIASPERFRSLLHVDRTSGIWAVIEGVFGRSVLTRGKGSGVNGQIVSAPVGTTLAAPALDWASGDVWVATLFPPGAARFSPDGSRTDLVTSIVQTSANGDAVGDPVPLVLPGAIVPDPHRGHVWVVSDIDPGNGNGGRSINVFDPYARRLPSAQGVARGLRGQDVTVVTSAQMETSGESVVDAAVQVQTGDLIVLTSTLKGYAGCGDLPASGDARNYYLRRVKPITGGAWASAPTVCVAPAYVQQNDDTPVRMARDLSTGDICVAYATGSTGYMSRHDRESLAAVRSGAAGSTNFLTDVAADPKVCWATGNSTGPSGAVWILTTAGTPAMRPLSAPSAFPAASTIRPVLGLDEIRQQKAATKIWIGGADGDPIELFDVPGPTLDATRNREALPISSDFEMQFIKH